MAAQNKAEIVITAVDATKAAFASVGKQFDSIKAGAASVVGALSAISGVSFAGATLSIGAFVKSTADAQDEFGKLAQKAGIGVEAFSGLSYAAKLAGADSQALVTGSKKLSEGILEAARSADQGITTFGALGIAVKDSSGTLRSTDAILLDVADKFAGMEDGAQKSALAVKLFGKSGLELIPFLNQGKAGISDLTAEAKRLGLTVSGDAARASEQFNDNLDRLAAGAQGIVRTIGNGALPILNAFVDDLVRTGISAGGAADQVRGLATQSAIEDWARKGAIAVATVADGFRYVAAAAQASGVAIGGAALAAFEAANGNFDKAASVLKAIPTGIEEAFTFEALVPKVQTFFEEFNRTVRVNGEKFVLQNADDAARVQKIYDDFYAAQSAKSKNIVEFDEAALKRQDELRKKYGDEEKRRVMGEKEFAKAQIRERYEAEITALRGAADEAVLSAEIRKKMDRELLDIDSGSVSTRVDGERQVLEAVRASSAARLGVEREAATEVVALWNQANAVKAAETGGAIRNAGTPGEFVSSWNAAGEYIGQLGKSVSAVAALGNATTSDGRRRLSIQEEISMLNGYARFATGGSFMVGGRGGTDSTPVHFLATPGERVTVETPAQQRSSGGISIGTINLPGISNARQFVAELREMLRTDPGLLGTGMARAG